MAILNYDFSSAQELFKYTSGYGSMNQGMTNALAGLSMTRTVPSYKENKDNQGYTFFTRPQLNFTTSTLRSMREFDSLLTNQEDSIPRYIRCMLDPRQASSFGIKCGMVNEKLPFIPVLTNALKSLTGFQDIVMPDFTSKPGLVGESWSMPDGSIKAYGVFDIDCTFYNFTGQPISSMVYYWLQYMYGVFSGMIGPYVDMLRANEMDFNTRIYRLIMDETMTQIRGMCATGAAFPVSAPLGEMFNYNSSEVFNSTTKDITIRFKTMGVTYNDSILAKEFNDCVGIFCPEVAELNTTNKSDSLVFMDDMDYIVATNFRCIPWIDVNDMSLKWVLSKNSKAYQMLKKLFG